MPVLLPSDEAVPKAPSLPWDPGTGESSESPKNRAFMFMPFVTYELICGQGRVK